MARQEQEVNRVRIQFALDPADGQGVLTESLWAEPVEASQYRILSIPFFVFGISADDFVITTEKADGLEFDKISQRGGHSTYRVFLQEKLTVYSPMFEGRWRKIATLGAKYENANDRFIAVDVPPESDIKAIYQLFEDGEREGVWLFEEANYEEAR